MPYEADQSRFWERVKLCLFRWNITYAYFMNVP